MLIAVLALSVVNSEEVLRISYFDCSTNVNKPPWMNLIKKNATPLRRGDKPEYLT